MTLALADEYLALEIKSSITRLITALSKLFTRMYLKSQESRIIVSAKRVVMLAGNETVGLVRHKHTGPRYLIYLSKGEKVKARIWQFVKATATGNHMPYEITQCYQPPGSNDFPPLPLPKPALDLATPQGCEARWW